MINNPVLIEQILKDIKNIDKEDLDKAFEEVEKELKSEEQIENAYWKGYIQKQNEAMEICKQCKYIKKIKELESEKQKLIEKLEEKQAEIDSLNEFYETYDINYEGQTVLIDRNRFKEVIGADKDFSILVVNKLPEVEEN